MAAGRDPADSHDTSYLLSATKGLSAFKTFAVNGFTEIKNKQMTVDIEISLVLTIQIKCHQGFFGLRKYGIDSLTCENRV